MVAGKLWVAWVSETFQISKSREPFPFVAKSRFLRSSLLLKVSNVPLEGPLVSDYFVIFWPRGSAQVKRKKGQKMHFNS